MYEIRIEICPQVVDELKQLYEESNRLSAAMGYEQWTFERWYKDMLMFGSIPHIKANAELMNLQNQNYLNELKNNTETERSK